MTEKWYRTVLERLHDGSIVLDVGVGTGGALLRCIDLIESKDLKIIGIDISISMMHTSKLESMPLTKLVYRVEYPLTMLTFMMVKRGY